MRIWKLALRTLSSLKLAVAVILSLSASLATGTILESLYDIKTGRYWVYHSMAFRMLLGLLGVNILFVALSRWPWKRAHTAFLLAHLGILLLLVGSAVTQKFGLDGSMRVTEGETTGMVELDQMYFFVRDGEQTKVFEVPWIPPMVDFRPISRPEYGLEISRFLPHADPEFEFSPAPEQSKESGPALHLRLSGGPMRIKQEFWLWGADPSWSDLVMGPARFVLVPPGMPLGKLRPTPEQALLEIQVGSRDELKFAATSRTGVKTSGQARATERGGSLKMIPGWSNLELEVLQFIPRAINTTHYVSSRNLYGDSAPPPALFVQTKDASAHGSGLWLGLGDQARMVTQGREITIGFSPRRIMLPFGLNLREFKIARYEGSDNPASYSSLVSVDPETTSGRGVVEISMNEPLQQAGYTFYQASYVPEAPRPKTSIFSVNRDPGRSTKYAGSLLLVAGVILLFARKYWLSRKGAKG